MPTSAGKNNSLHDAVHSRRVEVLAKLFSALLDPKSQVLDVGSGDGYLGKRVAELGSEIKVVGIDVFVRENTHIPVKIFDGINIPFADKTFDVVMLVDVVHHASDPIALLKEAARVARRFVLLKDHTRNGLFAETTLSFMDWVGNARHGVQLLYNYWSEKDWREILPALGMGIDVWRSKIGLYPWPCSLFFDRKLQFIARLSPGVPVPCRENKEHSRRPTFSAQVNPKIFRCLLCDGTRKKDPDRG